MSTFLGTFGTETFRRAQGGKFVVSSDSGKPVLKQIGHRFQLASVGIAISQRFKAGPACAISSSGQFPSVFPSCQTAWSPSRCRHQNWTRPRERGLGLAALLSHRPKHWQGLPIPGTGPNESSAGGANFTWASSRAGLPCLGIGACLKGALGLVIMVCGSCLLATVNCSC